MTALKDESETKHFPYSFYSHTFFDETLQNEWADFGNELLAFKHYFVKSKTESHYYYLEDCRAITDTEVTDFHHSVHQQAEDLSAWERFFSEIKKNIVADRVKKVVASRQVIFETDGTFHIESILQKLITNNPNCFIFAYQKGQRIFFGASPELLVRKNGAQVSSYALAGTLAKSDRTHPEDLLNNSKNLLEHQIVIDKIKERLMLHADKVAIQPTGLMELKNVWHLQTKLETINTDKSLIDWAQLLHPTPALGGEPSKEALQLIRDYENYNRGLYASPFGLIDSDGNGSMIVAIRSALIDGKKLHIYAGAGIVADSQFEAESLEVITKLQTILEVL
ncbi:MAG: isochorismate synthase [Streptococcaceae bacterium]|nr:isochorismate synthase [Streptococcaceae bacterium]